MVIESRHRLRKSLIVMKVMAVALCQEMYPTWMTERLESLVNDFTVSDTHNKNAVDMSCCQLYDGSFVSVTFFDLIVIQTTHAFKWEWESESYSYFGKRFGRRATLTLRGNYTFGEREMTVPQWDDGQYHEREWDISPLLDSWE